MYRSASNSKIDPPVSSCSITTPELDAFDNFNLQLQANALKVTRDALSLPADVAFHRSIDSVFSKDIDAFSSRVLSLTNRLLTLAASADTTKSARNKEKVKLEDEDDVVDNFRTLVVEPMDQLLERTDICLDEYLGRLKPPAIVVNPVAPHSQKQLTTRGYLDPVLRHSFHLPKPQLSFRTRVINDDSPWHPSLSHKYHAKVPLGYDYRDPNVGTSTSDIITTHPYRYEITHICYPEHIFKVSVPVPPKSFLDTPFTWVSTTQGLQSMLAVLRQASEIAVDLEHHSHRSFAGFVCLMQISTREADWVVDTLAIREELTELNEIFADPNTVKVFHGADSDIVWLQQDFSLYVVNLFDTFHASKLLDFPRHGLANLLEMYCDLTPDKRYQLADWRIRPLPQEMLHYARSDTHFLLYIYDNLRNALIDRAQSLSPPSFPQSDAPSVDSSRVLIKQVLARSEETALRTYEREGYDAAGGTGSNGWDTLARKWNKGALLAGGPDVGVSSVRREVYKGVHWWRDRVAREHDESIGYILPTHILFQMAEHPPADMAALLAILHPVPLTVKRRAGELLDVIRNGVQRRVSILTNSISPLQGEAPMLVEKRSEGTTLRPEEGNVSSTSWPFLAASGLNDMVASTSSLFGSTLSTPLKSPQTITSAKTTFAAPKSALFGNIIRVTPPSAHVGNARFQELVARINSTLVIAPSAPKVAVNSVKQELASAAKEETTLQNAVSGMQVEIPYVPASHRKASQLVEDSIVVIGQARPKKRKKAKAPIDDTEALSSSQGSNLTKMEQEIQKPARKGDKADQDQKPFDFSTVPNILDNNPSVEDTKKKRHKKQKKGGMFYGDFPAPPKAHSELKSGNQSHTFK